MKDINFVKTLSPKQQHNLRRWASFSFGLFSIMIIAVLALQVPQLITLKEIKSEYQSLAQNISAANTTLTHNQTLKNKVGCLGKQCSTINTLACATQTPRTCINSIVNACGPTIYLQACNLKNKCLEICAQCNGIQQATYFLEQLTQHTVFSDLKLVSLQPAPGNFVSFTIKGNIE